MLTLAHVGRRTSSRRNTGVAPLSQQMSWLSATGSAANSLKLASTANPSPPTSCSFRGARRSRTHDGRDRSPGSGHVRQTESLIPLRRNSRLFQQNRSKAETVDDAMKTIQDSSLPDRAIFSAHLAFVPSAQSRPDGSAIDIPISGDWKTARSQFPASHATNRAVVARSRPKFGQPYAALARALPSIG